MIESLPFLGTEMAETSSNISSSSRTLVSSKSLFLLILDSSVFFKTMQLDISDWLLVNRELLLADLELSEKAPGR